MSDVVNNDDLEALLSGLSSAMLSVPAHGTDREIGIWLGNTCEALNIDRAGVFERKERGGSMNMTHTWVRPPYPPDPPEIVADTVMKSIVRRVMAGESFKFSHPNELPSEMDDLKAWVTEHGPKAGAAVPLRAGNEVFGMVTFGKFSNSREWPVALLRRLNLVAEIFGNAIQRRRAEDQLQQVQSELRIASRRNMMSELVASLAHEINQPAYFVLMFGIMAIAGVLAEFVDLPGIVEAFLAGLAVNRTVHNKPAKLKLEFFGQAFFIPIFFIATGFLINPLAFARSIAGNFVLLMGILLALIAGKFIAAQSAGRAFKYSSTSRMTMWSLTLPQMAATLAAALTAFKTFDQRHQRLVDERMLNVVFMLMLTTAILGPILTQHFARRMAAEGP